jgi:hypothetical protein
MADVVMAKPASRWRTLGRLKANSCSLDILDCLLRAKRRGLAARRCLFVDGLSLRSGNQSTRDEDQAHERQIFEDRHFSCSFHALAENPLLALDRDMELWSISIG